MINAQTTRIFNLFKKRTTETGEIHCKTIYDSLVKITATPEGEIVLSVYDEEVGIRRTWILQ